MSEDIAMVTGHRPNKIGGAEGWVRRSLGYTLDSLRTHGVRKVYSGMALGVDQWWAEAALERGFEVVASIPFENQSSRWSHGDKARYEALLARCSEVTRVGEPGWPFVACLIQRDIVMVEGSTIRIAVWNGSSGGTGTTVREMIKRDYAYMRLDPQTRDVTLTEGIGSALHQITAKDVAAAHLREIEENESLLRSLGV